MSFFRRHSAKNKQEKATTVKKGQSSAPHTPIEPSVIKPENINGRPAFGSSSRPAGGLLMVEDDFFPGDLGVSLQAQDEYTKKSRLSKSLLEILKDHEAVPYLIQYMESCKASALLRFWLDSESFQASTWTRIRSHSLQSVSKNTLLKRKRDLSTESLSFNKDITSPVSGTSLDCVDREPESVEASSSPETSNHCSNTGNVQADTTEKQSNGTVDQPISRELTDKDRNIPNDFGSFEMFKEQNSDSNDCDSRVREKCKAEGVKNNMTLPIITCDSSGDTEPSENNTDSAISFRDITSPSPTEDCGNSSETSAQSDSYPVLGGSNIAEKLKKSVEQDAVRIFTKYLAQEATHPIGIADDLRNDTIRKICQEDGQVDPECFVECQTFAVNKIERKYFDGFKASVYHCKYQVEVLTSGKLHLTDIMYNDTALFYFMEYLEQEGLSHLLHFVMAADNFECLLCLQGTYDGVQAQEDAMVLYDKYFSLQAASPLGFPDSIRFEVEGNICREEGPMPDCFAKPRQIVLHTIQRRHLQHYLTSDMYYKYLSELVSAVQTMQDFPLGQRQRRGSESSSEHSAGTHSVGNESISSRNTLLASGTSRRIQLNKLDEHMKNMTMDLGLLNPDKLWERPESGRMSLGKIDGLGQFVSRFDPDPEAMTLTKKKSASGSKFFKSKKEKEKEQEEMARKVAEMILKDVTSVTQAISAIKNSGNDT